MSERRVLLAGETWLTYGIHQKGFAAYTTGEYADGSVEFRAALEGAGCHGLWKSPTLRFRRSRVRNGK